MTEPTLLFVYGSLLCGEPGFFRLRGARFLGRARTAPHFTLVSLGHYPALLPGGSIRVAGELYAVPPPTLAELDDYEGHPDLYRREAIALDEGRRAEAYLLGPDGGQGHPEIPSGDWRGSPLSRPAVARVYRVCEALPLYPNRKD